MSAFSLFWLYRYPSFFCWEGQCFKGGFAVDGTMQMSLPSAPHLGTLGFVAMDYQVLRFQHDALA